MKDLEYPKDLGIAADSEAPYATGLTPVYSARLAVEPLIRLQAAESLDEACEVVSRAVRRYGFSGILVSLVNLSTKQIEARFASGVRFEKIKTDTMRKMDGWDILAVVLKEGKPDFILDSRVDPRCDPEAVRKADLVSQYILPLTTHASKIGTLQIDCGSRTPNAMDISFLDLLGTGLAFCLQRHILQEDVEVAIDMAIALEKQALAGFASAGIAHQLSHEFRPIRAKVKEWLRRQPVRDNGDLHQFFEELDDSFEKWLETARTPLIFARAEGREAKASSVGSAIKAAAKLWYHRARMADCRITVKGEIPDTRVLLTNVQLQEIISCLIVNSIQAKARQIDISVSLKKELISDTRVDAARIEIADNGGGITADIRGLVFDADFTTKEERDGSGLGLPIARGIARTAGGRVELIESVP